MYETIEDESMSYIKLINLQSKVVCNRIFGSLPHTIVLYLMSVHIGTRPIYFMVSPEDEEPGLELEERAVIARGETYPQLEENSSSISKDENDSESVPIMQHILK